MCLEVVGRVGNYLGEFGVFVRGKYGDGVEVCM